MFQCSRATSARTALSCCRTCEPLCGLVATVEGPPGAERLVSLRPDDEHPLGRGYARPEALDLPEVQREPERVMPPLRRIPGGAREGLVGAVG